jgi:pimeloyl-ACP methyl ester carboxylesterase
VQRTKASIGGVELELCEGGEGAPLVWLHGGEGFDENHAFAGLLAARHRVIAPSHPGFGKSSLPEWLDHVDDIAHLYLELMDRLALTRVAVAGCSIGGWIAAEMATKSPERISRLVLVAPVGVKVGPSDRLDIPDIFAMPQEEVAQLMFHDPATQPAPADLSDDALAAMVRNRETLAMLTWEPWMHNPKLRRRLHRAAMPALFVRGESDGIVSDQYLRAYAGLLPDARTVVIAEAGHAPHLEQPQAFASMVLKFLDESERKPAQKESALSGEAVSRSQRARGVSK